MKKEKVVAAKEEISILVDGGYQPDKIIIPFGKTTN
jgi:plastocyanin domain-containing protein